MPYVALFFDFARGRLLVARRNALELLSVTNKDQCNVIGGDSAVHSLCRSPIQVFLCPRARGSKLCDAVLGANLVPTYDMVLAVY